MSAGSLERSSSPMPDPALILFDVDGTIFDSQNLIVSGFENAFRSQGYEPPARQDILYTVGLSLDNAIATMRPDFDGAAIEALASAYVHAVSGQHGQPMPFFAGMRTLIGALSQIDHLWLGVATGKNRRGLDPLLEANGMYNIFTIKQTADLHPSKPAPDMVVEAYERYGVAPERTVMIGDTSFDVQMGINAGVKTIGVTWGYHGDAVADVKPDRVASGADEIYQALKDWNFL